MRDGLQVLLDLPVHFRRPSRRWRGDANSPRSSASGSAKSPRKRLLIEIDGVPVGVMQSRLVELITPRIRRGAAAHAARGQRLHQRQGMRRLCHRRRCRCPRRAGVHADDVDEPLRASRGEGRGWKLTHAAWCPPAGVAGGIGAGFAIPRRRCSRKIGGPLRVPRRRVWLDDLYRSSARAERSSAQQLAIRATSSSGSKGLTSISQAPSWRAISRKSCRLPQAVPAGDGGDRHGRAQASQLANGLQPFHRRHDDIGDHPDPEAHCGRSTNHARRSRPWIT